MTLQGRCLHTRKACRGNRGFQWICGPGRSECTGFLRLGMVSLVVSLSFLNWVGPVTTTLQDGNTPEDQHTLFSARRS